MSKSNLAFLGYKNEGGICVALDGVNPNRVSMKAEWNSSTVVAGRYQIRRLIGRGGAGAVFEAYDPNLGKAVAIKALLGVVQPEQAQRFQMEATATGRLKHRNIVTVMDFGLTETDQVYMVSEFVEGLTLAERLKQSGVLAPYDFLSVMTQICEAMEHAHDAGIVHRDLKPENIILVQGEDGMLVKIVDFGIAKMVDLDGSLTRTGVRLGSPYYMSPEQVTAGDIDHRSDIYSLGAVMFRCLEGRPPFQGDNSIVTMQMHVDEPFPPVTKIDSDTEYGELIKKVISGCTAKDPDRRIQSMSGVLEILDSIELDEDADCISEVNDDVPKKSDSSNSAKSADLSKKRFLMRAAAAALALVTVAVVFVSIIEPNFLRLPVYDRKLADVSADSATMLALNSLNQSISAGGHFLPPINNRPKTPSGIKRFIATDEGSWTNGEEVSAADLKELLNGTKNILLLKLSRTFVSPEMITILVNSEIPYLELKGITFKPGTLIELRKMPKLQQVRISLLKSSDYDFVSSLDRVRYCGFDGAFLEEPFKPPRLPKNVEMLSFYNFQNGVSIETLDGVKSMPMLRGIEFDQVKLMNEEQWGPRLSAIKQLDSLIAVGAFTEIPRITGLDLDTLIIMHEPVWTMKGLAKLLRDNHVKNLQIKREPSDHEFESIDVLFAVVPTLENIYDADGKRGRDGKRKP